jgi:hypothetical protein
VPIIFGQDPTTAPDKNLEDTLHPSTPGTGPTDAVDIEDADSYLDMFEKPE